MAKVQNRVSDNKKKHEKTGKYNTNKTTRHQNKVQFTATIFEPSGQVDGTYLSEFIGGGRFYSRFKPVQTGVLFVKTTRTSENGKDLNR